MPLPTHPALRRFALLAIAVSALAACKREQPAPTDVPEAAPQAAGAPPVADAGGATATLPGTDAVSAVDDTGAQAGVQPEAVTIAGIDAKTFAGTFSAEGARLELKPDGTYASSVHAASADADLAGSGTWTAEDGGAQLLLDSDDKREPDQRYTVVSREELRQVGGDRVLRRAAH